MHGQALFIAGPTASGKSATALAVAQALSSQRDAVVINADSMQLYRDLTIITARPTAGEVADIPHRLYGTLDGAVASSVADWAHEAMDAVKAAWAAGQYPILVGGTGLYFKVLVDGIADIPDIPPSIRAEVRTDAEKHGSAVLHQRLCDLDPETASRLQPGDRQRVCRALEVRLATGRSLADFQAETPPGPLADAALTRILLMPDRVWLYERCNKRFDQMLERGALAEVQRLANRRLSPDLPVMRTLGVPPLLAYLRGETSLDQAVEAVKTQTRRFAKRQMTWFRHQCADWTMLDAKFMTRNLEEINNLISKKRID